MRPHPFFPALLLADDDELGEALGAAVRARRTVQEWPLAVTERVDLADGRRFAVKTQLPPSVEPAFYRQVRSALLPDRIDLGVAGSGHRLAISWQDRPTLAGRIGEPDYPECCRAVEDAIAAIDVSAPVHLDLSTPETWALAVDETRRGLRAVISGGRFRRVPLDLVDAFVAWAHDSATLAEITDDTGLVHGDLTPDEVFLTEDGGCRVIDWQRPVRGPRGIDRAALLRMGGIEPADHVPRYCLQVEAYLRLHWAVQCATEVLPGLPPEGYQTWAIDALQRIGELAAG
ncbi:hypothetical protein FHX74_001042 [Friedmanniella endophytica]|uniref:Aminoglycoside phosphotransferase domain-containing protein n=1 Tax=Microlunatus kandeliicorticis TaxID=1759536 RepID=A0A7W3P534_9ACTN|nr:phosphotransferase [Microlunatus kandeliicorticis]MBA8793437.1 hypothetical protein [Microlunatus kandeliicorticis]